MWKDNKTGRFALLHTYPICRWSGELGPKFQTGDHQAPEGFYSITPGLMNPNSNYYLAINTGFPNTYERANGRTGSFLMIHGACLSVGCYPRPTTIAEIHALAREAFFVAARRRSRSGPCVRMTPLNMARHRNRRTWHSGMPQATTISRSRTSRPSPTSAGSAADGNPRADSAPRLPATRWRISPRRARHARLSS